MPATSDRSQRPDRNTGSQGNDVNMDDSPAEQTQASPAGIILPDASSKAGDDEDRQALIRQRAYQIWEREGRPEGHMDRHWHQAEREIDQESPS
jgi:hypothetical protein